MKTFLLSLFLFSVTGVYAQSGLDGANSAIISACQASEGGIYLSHEEGSCKYEGCAYKSTGGSLTVDGTNRRVTGGCDLRDMEKKAKAAKKKELDKKEEELRRERESIDGFGDRDGDGDASGSGSGSSSEDDGGPRNAERILDLDSCDFTLTGTHRCWKKCAKWDRKLKTFVEKRTKACANCLAASGIVLKGGKGSIGNSIRISNVDCVASGRVRAADGSCIDASGRVSTGGGGSVVIDGGVSGEPAFCRSKKKTDKEDCAAWRRGRGRFNCSSSSRDADCMGDDYYDIQSRYDRDCVGGNCRGRDRRSNAWLGDAFGALFTAGGQVGSAYFTGRAYERANEAWAGAAAAGFEQCQISQNNYLAYTVDNQLPAVSPDQRNAMNCNGYQLNSFGGMGGGGMGAWLGGGYSPGMIGGMMGPYGGYNPYGGIQGGIVGGFAGGMQGGYVGGYPGGYAGGMAVGGYAGGYPGGYAGGMAVGGFAGGMQGGYVGGYPGGYAGGMAVGGYAGGYPGGFQGGMAAGGFAQGISLAGGFAGGMQGGYVQGGYAQGGFQGGYVQGGYAQGGFQGGFAGGIAGGFAQGGFQGGYPGGGMYPGVGGWGSGTANGGGWPGYGGAGNYWGATSGYGGQMDYGMSMSASNYDRSLQQQGMSYQMGMNAAPYGAGGYGSAGFHPMNAGYGFGM